MVDDFIRNLQAPAFVVYAVLLSATIALMLGFQDQYGYRHVSYYVLLCSLLGSVTVISCKGVSTSYAARLMAKRASTSCA